jgi:hypothetical protein
MCGVSSISSSSRIYTSGMTLERNPMFAGETFLSHIKKAKQAILADAQAHNPRNRRSSFATVKDRDQILKEQTLAIPQITSKAARVRDSEIEYTVSFKGANGTFFRFQPTAQPTVERPVGSVISNALYLYTENSGDATAIKAELARKFEGLSAWYDALREEIEKFNQKLPDLIDKVFDECEEEEQRVKALEDELNS